MKFISDEQKALLAAAKRVSCKEDCILDSEWIKDLNWEEILQISLRHKILPVIYKTLYNLIPMKYQALFDQKYFDTIKKANIRLRELDRILQLAQQKNIDIILLKGPALAEIIYGDIYARQFGDLDLLVTEDNMGKMYYLLSDIGFVQETGFDKNTNRFNTIDKPVFKYNSNFHEFQCIKDVGDKVYIFAEIKRASSAIPLKYIGDFLKNIQNINISGIEVKTSNLTYTFLHLCSNFFTNFETEWGVNHETNLRDIIDIYAFLLKYCNILNWTEIVALSNKYEITHKIYYVFTCLEEIFGEVISKEVIQLFNPNKVLYDFNGNSDGSINAWKSNFIFRLFNDEERKQEFVKINKLKIYNVKNYNNHDEVERETFLTTINAIEYRRFNIDSLQWDIDYIFTYDNRRLYLNLNIENNVYEQLGDYYLFVSFVDNSLDNVISNRTITITKDKTLQVLFDNLQQCSWQFIELGNNMLIKIVIPFECLNMDFKDSGNRIFHNIYCREKIGSDGFRNIASKYDSKDYWFLKIPDNFIGLA